MRFKIDFSKKQLEQHGYSNAPIRQILMLDISQLARDILLSLFTHSEEWKVSYRQINRMFYHEVNRKRIKLAIDELKTKKYLSEKNNVYYIDIDKIQSDYELNSKVVAEKYKQSVKTNNQYRKKNDENDFDVEIDNDYSDDISMDYDVNENNTTSKNNTPKPTEHIDKKNWDDETVYKSYKSNYFNKASKLIEAYGYFKYFAKQKNEAPLTIDEFDDIILVMIYDVSKDKSHENIDTDSINHFFNKVELTPNTVKNLMDDIYKYHSRISDYTDTLTKYRLTETVNS